MADKVKARYIGTGGYLNTVPASDLSDEQWALLTDEEKAEVVASGLYELRGAAKAEGEKAERKVEREDARAEVQTVTVSSPPVGGIARVGQGRKG